VTAFPGGFAQHLRRAVFVSKPPLRDDRHLSDAGSRHALLSAVPKFPTERPTEQLLELAERIGSPAQN
jgi:hypothetical protein